MDVTTDIVLDSMKYNGSLKFGSAHTKNNYSGILKF